MRTYIDTSALVALAVRQEGRHERARDVYTALRAEEAVPLASDYVVDEVLTRLMVVAGAYRALTVGEMLRSNEIVDIRPVDREDFENAWRLFRKFADQSLSFTDCTILAQMERLGIERIFTFDQGFQAAGVKVVP